jgi:hypothetical protein
VGGSSPKQGIFRRAERRQARQTEEARLLTESKDLLAQLGRLQALQASVGRWRLLAVIAVILWAATLAWLLVGL